MLLKTVNNVRIVLQARLSSRRLPAKCLLPLGGIPLVVLSALRAANSGLPVVVATSSEQEDRILADVVTQHGLKCVRGSLNDVYSRFLAATEDMDNDEWVVRLTADNCFPDGAFIASLIEQAIDGKLEYLGTSSPADGLPYGLSAEVFTVRALRSVAEGTLSGSDREHVTPAIRRKYGAAVAKFDSKPLAQLRCTVDTRNDYFGLLAVFNDVADPISASSQQLCERLAQQKGTAAFRIPWKPIAQGIVGAITLGTAQIGIKQYGRVNISGQPSDENAFELLDQATRHGVTHIDTARAYGDAEVKVGAHLNAGLFLEPTVITKLDPLADLVNDASKAEIVKWVEASVYKSCNALRKNQLDVLMLHRWSHYRSHGGGIWETVCRLREMGIIHQLGASVYTPEEAIEALEEKEILHLQIPFNLLDHRWRSAAFKGARARRPDVVIYGRSAYLQGILISEIDAWPQQDGYDVTRIVEHLDSLVKAMGRQSRADLCLAYIQATAVVDSIVMGVETVRQLKENVALVCLPPLTEAQVKMVEEVFTDTPEWLLDPSKWS